ncbi:MAG: PHP domain-containing protein, partial [Clostridia bacterium]|nr:PHP domain-containing protein [Clostridia bacterium]
MQSSLADFFAQFISDTALVEQLRQQNALVTGLVVKKSGLVTIQILTTAPWPADLLVLLEDTLENTLPAQEVLIRQTFAEPLAQGHLQQAAASLSPWLIRHLRKKDPFHAALLHHAQFIAQEMDPARVEVHVTENSRDDLARTVSDELAQLTRSALGQSVGFEFMASTQDLRDYTAEMLRQQQAEARRQLAAMPGQTEGEFCSAPARTDSSGQGVADRQAGALPASAAPAPSRAPASARNGANGNGNGSTYRRAPKPEGVLWGKVNGELKRQAIRDLSTESGLILMEGEIFSQECRTVSNGTRLLYKFALTDLSSSITCILFAKPEDQELLDGLLKKASYLRVSAEISFDAQFSKDLQARVLGLQEAKRPAGREDKAEHKRVELHAHTKMSTKDAVCETRDLVKLAARFGHPAVAITDHGVVQSFPDAASARSDLKRKGQEIKIIYGMEGYLVDDGPSVAWSVEKADLSAGFVALDVETTGLDPAKDRVIEVALVPFLPDGQGGFTAGEPWVSLVNPQVDLPPKITELTGITALDLQGAPDPWPVFCELAERIGDKPVVAHNAFFDLAFIRYEGFRTPVENDPRLKFNPPLVDTLALSRAMIPELANHKLNTVAAHLGVGQDRHHRADDDARVCGEIFARLFLRSGAASLSELNTKLGHLGDDEVRAHRRSVYHVILLAKDNLGLYNLYRLVSESHTRFFHMRPRIPRALLQYFRTGLVIGSACEAGELFQTVLETYRASGNQYDAAKSLLMQQMAVDKARFYDYLEIQPISNNGYYLRQESSGLHSDEDLRNLNRLIVALGQRAKKPVCATCDVHFLERADAEFRRILLADNGYSDYAEQPDLHLRTTGEMLAEFAYLGDAIAREVVITQPQAIADQVDPELKPFPDGSFPPIISSAPDDVRHLTWETAQAIYGRDGELPDLVRERIERELHSIIDNGFSVMYYIAH